MLAYMLKVMRDLKEDPSRRDWMAKALLPCYHARRAPENKKRDTVPPVFYTHPPLEETIEQNCEKTPINQRGPTD
jgi:hypothetical protein